MIKRMILVPMFGILFITACGAKVKPTSQDSVTSVHALCNVEVGTVPMVCADYSQDTSYTKYDCDNVEMPHYQARGANYHTYGEPTNSSVAISCASVNSTHKLLGSCLMNGQDVRYYVETWTADAASSDCTSARQGAWQAPN